ncbi:MAG: alanine/ornithine racemase family PLP-dependent enzyme [Clostridia bacterium]|nr:alanine/ornithine racemase family PLP-dependent enzyme [Clostridia bacterium]
MIKNPKVIVDLTHLTHNAKQVIGTCHDLGIDVAGVVKGATGAVGVARAFVNGGANQIASSRVEQLEAIKAAGFKEETMLLRVPMLSEIPDVVRWADITLNSELTVIEAQEEEAARQHRIQKIILMADMGDLREGYWDKDEMAEVALKIEKEMPHLQLIGVGTNLGCYGSVAATPEKLNELIDVAHKVEAKIGRKLQYISGGATSSYMRIMDGNLPKEINHLRIGEGILLARDFEVFYGYKNTGLYQDTFVLQAEIIEVKEKPSHPVGELAVDAFGHKPTYVDKGMRKKALLAIGKVDYGDTAELIPLEPGLEVLGASSDHTILDITECPRDLKVGDVVKFTINYATIVYLTNTENVQLEYIWDDELMSND